MFRCPVQDRSLTLLGAAVLVATRNPTCLLVPTIFAWNTIAETFVLAIFRNLCRYLAVDPGSEVEGEVHGRSVIHGDTPAQRLIPFVGCGKGSWMVFRQMITDFVHVGHEKQTYGSKVFVSHSACKGITNAKIGDFRSELFFSPVAGLGGSMEPLEMVLIHAVLHHL